LKPFSQKVGFEGGIRLAAGQKVIISWTSPKFLNGYKIDLAMALV
jgi:hypothetical protein